MNLEKIQSYLREHLSKERFLHTEGVASMMEKLVVLYGSPLQDPFIASWCHDIAREWSSPHLFSYAASRRIPFTEEARHNPILLHGPCGAHFSREIFALNDPAIFDAIWFHTTGNASPSFLLKMLFAADSLEEGRKHISQVYRKQVLGLTLNAACLQILKDSLAYLTSKNVPVAHDSLDFCRALQEAVASEV